MSQKNVTKAKQIQRTLGVRFAAGFLRNRGASLQEALIVLLGVKSERRVLPC